MNITKWFKGLFKSEEENTRILEITKALLEHSNW